MTLFSYLYIDTCVVCVWGSGWVDGGTCVVCVWGGGWVGGGTSYHPVTLYSYLHIDMCCVCLGRWVGVVGVRILGHWYRKCFILNFKSTFFKYFAPPSVFRMHVGIYFNGISGFKSPVVKSPVVMSLVVKPLVVKSLVVKSLVVKPLVVKPLVVKSLFVKSLVVKSLVVKFPSLC